ncbi:MAG: outer membrane beta-barrel protein [Armatimonadetes bacterium]|nr:outer membrane beta-barrel protein [Armatimonadota bacterium]
MARVPADWRSVQRIAQLSAFQCAVKDKLGKQNILLYGWINPSINKSSSSYSNVPLSYDLAANKVELDQAVLVFEKQPDTTQTDHVDYGFRLLQLYGTNYRYTIMKGILSDQLLKHNHLYGYDPVEMYGTVYYPHVAQGMVVRFGRYISPPDIEAQLTPQNYMYSHSLMFSVDPYTFMGVNAMIRVSKQWEIMAQIHGGNDMAIWSDSASPNVGLMARWASLDGRDGIWAGVNSIGVGKARHEHDNLQQIVGTWGHKFNEKLHMMTEAYYMWEYDAPLGGTGIDGPPLLGTGGGTGPIMPGKSDATGVVNYFQILTSDKDYVSIRNDYLNDPRGYRTGYKTAYSSHTLGYVRFLSPMITVRPELRYEHAYGATPYDVGARRDQWTLAADIIIRF